MIPKTNKTTASLPKTESETVNIEHDNNAAYHNMLTWFIGPRPPRLRCCC